MMKLYMILIKMSIIRNKNKIKEIYNQNNFQISEFLFISIKCIIVMLDLND